MDCVDRLFVVSRVKNAIGEVRSNMLYAAGVKRFLFVPRTTRGGHDGVRRMIRTQRRSEILRRKHFKMVSNRQNFTLAVEMIDGRELEVAGSNSKSLVLDSLKKFDDGRSAVRKPDWSAVFESRTDEMLLGLLGAAPRPPRQRSHDIELGATLGRGGLDVRRKRQVSVKDHSDDLGTAPEGSSGLGKETSGL